MSMQPTPTRLPSMSRTTVNFLLDVLLLLLFLLLIWCSVVLQFVFPTTSAAQGWTLWGWDRSQWSAFQFGALAAFTLAVLVHLMLHWTWVCGVLAGWYGRYTGRAKGKLDDGSRTLAGVATLIVILNLLGGAIALAALMIERPPP